MPAYIILMKYTDQGIKDIKNAPARIEEGFKAWEAMGGKVLGYYLLMGEYDAMAIGEGPSDEIATAFDQEDTVTENDLITNALQIR
jgi:uncharacterized protein with GYD domain